MSVSRVLARLCVFMRSMQRSPVRKDQAFSEESLVVLSLLSRINDLVLLFLHLSDKFPC